MVSFMHLHLNGDTCYSSYLYGSDHDSIANTGYFSRYYTSQ